MTALGRPIPSSGKPGLDVSPVIPAAKGTYFLVLRLDSPSLIQVGRFGKYPFQAGYYLYCGSAMGCGGLKARLNRHLSGISKPHWHIDWLRRETVVTGWGIHIGLVSLECVWSQEFVHLPGATIAVPGFGASDCVQGCWAHLVHFRDEPVVDNRVKLGNVNIWRIV